ncbi:hypothetical protein Gasu2_01390 [Galdieria sulphuraria]|uniref:Uncharacterized protein n=1 Tax=Galdieria sulphuraria TaxID=130081 RepID=M2WT96_GALSU|nr:uncharacterized protein Gasu_53440 [Galdieria sulphuraria]EME27125.1 hypothetical protein Gasu_53440 [Galdieria sulphuraria]GJD05683.1 hypothetical protein Gasu2_01390 [Galdieria sulphuraria]|eukprot:XP_005703645.1 hypothetical protein Gasu_53440 [Galdieria sulphuraria]
MDTKSREQKVYLYRTLQKQPRGQIIVFSETKLNWSRCSTLTCIFIVLLLKPLSHVNSMLLIQSPNYSTDVCVFS